MKHSFFAALLVCAPLLPAASFTNGQAARAEIGQFFFNSAQGTPSNQVLAGPSGLAYVNNMLFVADGNVLGASDGNDGNGIPIQGNRILTFYTNEIPGAYTDLGLGTTGDSLCGVCGFSAVNVLGQGDYTSYLPSSTTGPTATGTPGANGLSGTSSMNSPTAVATDGTSLAVADTYNNRVLIWKTIPTSINQAPDLVLGQTSLTTAVPLTVTNASTLHAPMGVWIQNRKLFVADTFNNRVLIWNTFPTVNGQAADVVLGAPNFTTVNNPVFTNPVAAANLLFNPVGVTSDGIHLFVSDPGYNRVLIWNQIPTANQTPADVVIGQPNMTTAISNNSSALCASNGTNADGTPAYPAECPNTLVTPRYALSDGTRLFVADSGNDRVQVFNQIPTSNGAAADLTLGQPNGYSDVLGSSTNLFTSPAINTSGTSDTLATPMSLAFDGSNLYVADLYDRRVSIFTPGDLLLPQQSILNAASRSLRQEGYAILTLAGTITAGDTMAVAINGNTYTYTETGSDTLATIAANVIKLVNTANSGAGDPSVLLLPGPASNVIYFSSRSLNPGFDTISFSVTPSNTANIGVTPSSSYLTGGTAGTVAPNTIVEIDYTPPAGGLGLADATVSSATCGSNTNISPTESTTVPTLLPSNCSGTTPQGSVEVFMDGVPTPLFMVSPTQIRALVPYEFQNRATASVYVRTVHSNGTTTVTTAEPLIITPGDPGFFAGPSNSASTSLLPAYQAQHQTGNPSVWIEVSLTTNQPGDVGTIGVNSVNYSHTVVAGDTAATIAAALAAVINQSSGAIVTATSAGSYLEVYAKAAGQAGTGITVNSATSPATGQTTAGFSFLASGNTTCCADNDSGPLTIANPALPNEIVTLFATGLGVLQDENSNPISVADGVPYSGPANAPVASPNVTVAGAGATLFTHGLAQGSVGVYSVKFQIPSTATANSFTPVYVAQNQFISNTVTIPVGTSALSTLGSLSASPNPISVTAGQTTGSTTLTWTATGVTAVQLSMNSPTATAVATGGATGSYAATNVTDGTVFYLTSSGTVLASITINVIQASTGVATASFPNSCPAAPGATWVNSIATAGGVSFTGQPNPIQVSSAQQLGQTLLVWNVPSPAVTTVDIYRDTDGTTPHATGGPAGQVTTNPNISNGTVFWLQDVTASAPGNTLACLRMSVITVAPTGFVTAGAVTNGQATLSWHCTGCVAPQVRMNDPATGEAFAAGSGGSVTVAAAAGTNIYLVDAGNASSPVVVAQTTLQAKVAPGTTSPTGKPLRPRPVHRPDPSQEERLRESPE
jgi:uncharacterized protein (TIGR03437 family)